MADAVIPRQQGDDFQARVFWLEAAQLMDDNSSVVRVSFELGPKAFDDVVIEHSINGAPQDHRGRPYFRDHLQTKWHVRPGEFGHEHFIDPEFSGGTTFSLLQRAHSAQREFAPEGEGARFQLYTNWNVTPPMRRLILNQTNALDVDALFQGGPRSEMGKFRKLWAEHLGIDEEELRKIVRTLGVNVRIGSGEAIKAHLNDRLARYGLKDISPSEAGFGYDDLIRKLHAQGRKSFDRKSFREMVTEQKLTAGPPAGPKTIIGVRSFMHAIEKLEARTTTLLNLVPYFEGRYLRDEASWDSTLYPSLKAYLIEQAAGVDQIQLILDAHISLAYAVGSVLDVKSGKSIEIEQRTAGRRFWSHVDTPIDPSWPKLTIGEEQLSDGAELAVAVSLTHDVGANVRAHLAANLPAVGTLLMVSLDDGPSQAAVRTGSHAAQLAETLAAAIRQKGRRPRIHMFIAAPNGFTFFLGQHHRVIGSATIYEWDFDGLKTGGYSPGLTAS